MSFPHSMTNGRPEWTRTDCEVLIAAREEVFPDQGDVSIVLDSYASVRRLLEFGYYRLTPAAEQVISLRPAGGGPEAIAALVSGGRLALVQRRVDGPIAASRVGRKRAVAQFSESVVETSVATTWIRLQVVHHATGAPLSGVRLTVATRGQEFRCRTNAFGLASVEGIEPGVCDAWCPLKHARLRRTVAFVGMGKPDVASLDDVAALRSSSNQGAEWVAHIDEHRVKTDETLKSIAEMHGYSWRELAEFNWGTSTPDVVNRHLRDDVGCTLKTLDGFNYRFSSEDEPGLIYIPSAWSQSGLATGQTHVIRVRIAAGFRLTLENEDGLRIPEAEYEAVLADGSRRIGRLGRGGLALIKDPPPGPVDVRYPDLDDIEAKSLAATVRKAFDDRRPQEIHRLFRYPNETIRRAFEAYDRYFNDYHGEGLRNDLRQEFFSDPDAELIFFGYMTELDNSADPQPEGESGPAPVSETEGVHA